MEVILLRSRQNSGKKFFEVLENRIKNGFSVSVIDLDSPSEICFQEELERIKSSFREQSVLVGFCFGGTYAISLASTESVDKVIAIDPPSGIVDSNGEKLEPDNGLYEKINVIASTEMENEVSGTQINRNTIETDHFFQGKERRLADLVGEELMTHEAK